MAKALDNVVVRDPQTGEVVFVAAGDEIPATLKDLIGDHLVEQPKRAATAKSE